MDQIIEVTINRSSKELVASLERLKTQGASERWMRINHYLAALKEHLETKVRIMSKCTHVELGSTWSKRMEQDEEAVEKITEGLRAWVPNVWSASQPLTNLATGLLAPEKMVTNVLNKKDRGTQAKADFFEGITKTASNDKSEESVETSAVSEGNKEQATDSQNPRPTYYDPIKRQPVHTFGTIGKQNKKMSIKVDEGESYASILADFDKKELDMRVIMDWPITSRPSAISNEQGGSRPSSKSLFRNNIQVMSDVSCTCDNYTTNRYRLLYCGCNASGANDPH
jgi:hypothetical protein